MFNCIQLNSEVVSVQRKVIIHFVIVVIVGQKEGEKLSCLSVAKFECGLLLLFVLINM